MARVDHLAVRRPRGPPQPLGALSASDTLGTFPRPPPGARRTPGARTSQPERYLSSPSGALFSRGVRGISAEGKGDPPPQTAALACPLPRLHFKGKLLPDVPAAAPTGFARVMVMFQLLLRALLAFQRRGVPGGVRALPEPRGVAG